MNQDVKVVKVQIEDERSQFDLPDIKNWTLTETLTRTRGPFPRVNRTAFHYYNAGGRYRRYVYWRSTRWREHFKTHEPGYYWRVEHSNLVTGDSTPIADGYESSLQDCFDQIGVIEEREEAAQKKAELEQQNKLKAYLAKGQICDWCDKPITDPDDFERNLVKQFHGDCWAKYQRSEGFI